MARTGVSMPSAFGGLLGLSAQKYRRKQQERLTAMEEETTAKTEAREAEIRNYLDQIINTYSPGGSFLSGSYAQLEKTKAQDVASGTQQLISSGLYGTTTAAGLGKKWEEEVGTTARLKLEDLRYERLADALSQKASFVEGIENQYPDYGLIASLKSQTY